MTDLKKKIEIIKELLRDCDGVLIGAGAGLSVAAGLNETNLKFKEKFKDFVDAYDFKDFYSGGFYPFETEEEKWAYFARYFVTYQEYNSIPLYEDILKLVKDKDYFVITTNVDGCFEKAGFDTNKLFATQGDFVHIQCPTPCHKKLYESTSLFKEMVEKTNERKIPTELLPKCPKCGKVMRSYLRDDDSFIEDDYWLQHCDAYSRFIERNKDKKILLLEFGIGFNTPSIIRFPFERRTMEYEKWHLVRFNREYSGISLPDKYGLKIVNDWDSIKSLKLQNDFQNRFIPVPEDINDVINKLLLE